MIAGKPLLAHAIEQAQRCPLIDTVIVSTDNAKIADIAADYGAKVISRPAHLCTDEAKEFDSWKYALEVLQLGKHDIFVNLPATCPLRNDDEICRTIMCVAQMDAPMAFTIKKSRDFPIPIIEDGVRGSISYAIEEKYSVVGACYAATPEYIREHKSIFAKDKFMTVTIPDEHSLDIDTEYDFKVAKLLMENP